MHPEREKSVEEGMERESAPPFPADEVDVKERPVSVTSDGHRETSSTPGSEVLVPMIEEKLVEVTEREERVKEEEDVCMRECVVFRVEITD